MNSKNLLQQYQHLFERDAFSEETIQTILQSLPKATTLRKQTTMTAQNELGNYYDNLKPNLEGKTCVFHLRNRDARRKLKITWREQPILYCNKPKYLGVKLDLMLAFK
ncbi:Ras GTPase-activating-like protein IQGAP2, partial [Ophiophagus hannah]